MSFKINRKSKQIDLCSTNNSNIEIIPNQTETLVEIIDSQKINSTNFTGLIGPTGPEGPQGRKGPPGDKGYPGKSITGPTGPAGPIALSRKTIFYNCNKTLQKEKTNNIITFYHKSKNILESIAICLIRESEITLNLLKKDTNEVLYTLTDPCDLNLLSRYSLVWNNFGTIPDTVLELQIKCDENVEILSIEINEIVT